MKKTLVVVLTLFFASSIFSAASAKDCSEFNRITNWKGYSDCKKVISGKGSLEKRTGNFFGNINKKYKDLRKNVPETGSATWKKLKNEN